VSSKNGCPSRCPLKTVAQAGVLTGLLLVYNELSVRTPPTAIVFTQPLNGGSMDNSVLTMKQRYKKVWAGANSSLRGSRAAKFYKNCIQAT